MLIAEALRQLRTDQGLTQLAASKGRGAPDSRTLSHWENERKMPSLKLLDRYLKSLDLDFCDLQEALDKAEGTSPGGVRAELERLARRLGRLEARLGLEVPAAGGGGGDEAGGGGEATPVQ